MWINDDHEKDRGLSSVEQQLGRQRLFVVDENYSELMQIEYAVKAEIARTEATHQRPLLKVVKMDMDKQDKEVDKYTKMLVDSRDVIDEIYGAKSA